MSPDGGKTLSRTSSLVINSPTKSSTPGKRPTRIVVETVPDSQEEIIGKTGLYKGDIIDLSSESDDDKVKETPTKRKSGLVNDSDPFLSPTRNVPSISTKPSSEEVIEESSTEDDSDDQPHYLPRSVKSRRAVVSDSEDETEEEQKLELLELRRDAEPDDDGAILVLNDTPSSRKPAARDDAPSSKSKPKRPPVVPLVQSTSSGGQIIVADPSPAEAAGLPLPKRAPGAQALLPDYFTPKGKAKKKEVMKGTGEPGSIEPTSSTTTVPITSRSKPAAKRRTKKVIEQEKQAHLAEYAQALFDELNGSVFKGRLPKDTPLIWNKRLLATAGKARWHRDGKGVVTTSIELATKVLDCEERIRNTLSHEMCHLACWVINCNPKENHGRVWQGWVDEVMEKRPDIAISTKHTYDIQYKYEWQCQTATCKKVYGRFSNSIDSARSVCGVCKVGELVPLFKIRTRKTKATSNMAADKPRGSPILSASRPPGMGTPTPSPLKNNGVILITSDTESEREPLSGAEIDVGDRPEDGDIGDGVRVMTKPKASDDNIRKGKPADAEDVGKLMTQMSIIDLTSD